MADHPMNFTQILNVPATNDGFKLWLVEQAADASVLDNDTLTFTGTSKDDMRILSISSATGQVVNFDAVADVSGSARFTVDHPEAAASKHTFGTLASGTAETSVKGLVLARRN